MTEPTLHYLDMPGPRAPHSQERRLAWWEWPSAGSEPANHVVVCVHGLTRQARDFDVLATALSQRVRVVCVDVAGRGHSDWLEDPLAYQIPTYVTDLAVLLGHLRQSHALAQPEDEEGLRIDWVGTSMGGLIGMALAAQPTLGIRRLVLNDVGPTLEWSALERIGSYVGQAPAFASGQAAADYLAALSTGFGPHTPAQWLALTRPMLRPSQGGWTLHYDPAIAAPYRAMLQSSDLSAAREALDVGGQRLWQLYDAIQAPTLLLRGAQSDLLTADTARAMTQRGPRARCVEFAGVGHAPTLVADDQVAVVRDFLFAP